MSSFVDVAIIGAGPNGLSLAAQLSALGVDFRIFGKPMDLWRDHMPPGMRLKSDGASSDLVDASDELTLKNYCAENGLPHHDSKLPIPLATFTAYGMEFQKRFVPQLEQKFLTALNETAQGFSLRFDDGEIVSARRVVLAIGVQHFKYTPDFLKDLPEEYVTHSSRYGAIEQFRGKEVTVMGAGASAIDLAGLLKDIGADAKMMTRRPTIEFHAPPGPRSFLNRLRAPNTGMGAGWQLRVFQDEPRVFHALPEKMRLHKARTMLGPSAGWFMKDSIEGRVPILTGTIPTRVEVKNGKVHVQAKTLAGGDTEIVTSHLVAATGYKVDLRKLPFLNADVLGRIKSVENTPVLSTQFETSIPGLHMVGFAALNNFGPLVRFVLGARYQSRRLSAHLVAVLARGHHPVRVPTRAAQN